MVKFFARLLLTLFDPWYIVIIEEKTIERRLKKLDKVMSSKASVKYENDEMFITVDVDVFRPNKRNIEEIISRLVPVDKKHKTINVNYIK